jgi:hypothetical protein
MRFYIIFKRASILPIDFSLSEIRIYLESETTYGTGEVGKWYLQQIKSQQGMLQLTGSDICQ